MGKPAIRRLLDAVKRKKSVKKKGGILEKVSIFFSYFNFLHDCNVRPIVTVKKNNFCM